jgi:chorismate mutase/prephenate dehydratase
MADINDWRKKIDSLDAKIIGLLGQRAGCAAEIGKIKSQSGKPVFDPQREAEVVERLKKLNKRLPEKSVEAIYREVFSAARAIEKPTAVSFLGPEGTFSHEAAIEVFGSSCEFRPHSGFEGVVSDVEKGLADFGVLPIENSIEGPINVNLDLLRDSPLGIFAEKTIVAHQNLASKHKGLKKIDVLYSHPQPLGQCRQFILRELPGVEIFETTSTSGAAQLVANNPDSAYAAICSLSAARRYGLNVLKERIEDFPDNNNTRFIVLSAQTAKRTGHDKTSIAVSIKNRPGELHRLLGLFGKAKINLTKIASRPIPRSRWGYLFYIDFEGHREDKKTAAVLKQAARMGESLKILGSYPREK